MEYSSLREQPAGKLRDVNSSIEALFSHSELLPTELRIKLDTLHADITAILEDRQDWDGADSPRGARDPRSESITTPSELNEDAQMAWPFDTSGDST